MCVEAAVTHVACDGFLVCDVWVCMGVEAAVTHVVCDGFFRSAARPIGLTISSSDKLGVVECSPVVITGLQRMG